MSVEWGRGGGVVGNAKERPDGDRTWHISCC